MSNWNSRINRMILFSVTDRKTYCADRKKKSKIHNNNDIYRKAKIKKLAIASIIAL